MSRDPYRSSTGEFRENVQRWDTERFVGERDRRSSGAVYEDDRFRERVYYDEREPRYAREPEPVRQDRRQSITIEKEREREYYSPSPPRRASARPGFLRRQSSLDTFDRKPYRREEYGPPARREDFRPAAFAPIPLPRARALPPTRYYEDVKISETDRYGEDIYRSYPERVREREIVRSRPVRRSRSRSRSRNSRRREASVSSFSSESSATTSTTIVERKSEFPKRGKTRMPARLVHKQAIIDLGYAFEEEADVVVIQKALGPENIDEVIKRSEEYKSRKVEMSGGRTESVEEEKSSESIDIHNSEGGSIHEEERRESYERRDVSPARTLRSRSAGPTRSFEGPREVVERSNDIPLGALVLTASPSDHRRSERGSRAEIKALEAQIVALRGEKRSTREIESVDRVESGEVILVEKQRRGHESESGGLRVLKDKKGRMSMSIPANWR